MLLDAAMQTSNGEDSGWSGSGTHARAVRCLFGDLRRAAALLRPAGDAKLERHRFTQA